MTDVVPSDEAGSADIERFLTAVNSVTTEDPAAVSAAIVANILQAPTAEAVLQQASTTQAEDVIGQRLLVRGVRWQHSDIADGPGFYALIDAVDDQGEVHVITCGSRNVMAQLFRLGELNALPCHVAIMQQEKATAAGFFPMFLEGRIAP